MADLETVRQSVTCPLLRKDFLIDEAQIWEARAAGADSVLLIVAILPPAALEKMIGLSRSLGMGPIVEVHSTLEMAAALNSSAKVIGINNRDLRTMTMDLSTTERVMAELSARDRAGRIFVSESGLATPGDIQRVARAGVTAALVGESLLRNTDPAAAVRNLLAAVTKAEWPS